MNAPSKVFCPAITSLSSVDLKALSLRGVYFIQQGETGPIKIGWSTNVRSRLASLQTATHERLRLLLVLDGQPEDERRLHAWFARERRGGEWFHSNGELWGFIAAKLAPAPSPSKEATCWLTDVEGPCWGSVEYYSDGDSLCEGHFSFAQYGVYRHKPHTRPGDRECKFHGHDAPCWGEIERYGDAADTYCEAHHPVNGTYAIFYNKGADSHECHPPAVPDLYERLVGLEGRISELVHHLGKSEDQNGPEAVKADLWDVLTTLEALRKQVGGES